MTMLHVVVEASFDYNDEIYHTVEGDAGEPVVAFKDEKKANAECERRTIAWLRECHNLWEYGYGADEVISDVKALEVALGIDLTIKECPKCGRKFKKNENFCSDCGAKRGRDVDIEDRELNLSGESDETLKKVAGLLNFSPFKVVTVEQGD